MRNVGYLLLITLVTWAHFGTPAVGQVTTSDATATHAYLGGRIVLRQALAADEAAELRSIEALEAHVLGECPGVLNGAPPHVKGEKTGQSEEEVEQELLSAAFGVAEKVQHPADALFAKTVRSLRWSNSKLTRLLRSLAIEQADQSAIPPPDLCADMKSWVASDYTAVSTGTKEFLHRYSVVSSITLIESEPHEPLLDIFNLNALVARRLKPYENQADRLLARKALPPEVNITDPALRPILDAVGKVFVALGRSPIFAP
jgi:hypothetical protein